MEKVGKLHRIAGPIVIAYGFKGKMFDIVKVGHEKLMGEIIQIHGERKVIQVYEDTSGLKPKDPVINTGEPLKVDLGPGLLTSIYDGIQRPLPVLLSKMGNFITRGAEAPGLDQDKKWKFTSLVKKGDTVKAGQIVGTVQETETIEHRIMIPPGKSGKVASAKSGSYTVSDTVCTLDDGTKIGLMQSWPVRRPRPINSKLIPAMPLITGQRIFDALFPLAKGGVAAIPGPFGAGKTVSQQQLAKWSDADIIVYVGCGERGNEMTDVLTEFPELTDPKTGKPLMNRTVLIANTSNMPVAAREASIYTGVTIAEYFRDMGYSVALMADSTSRWAEAMREISSRLEEMPGEEGYPAYLSTRLASFYERAGRVIPLGAEQEGSVTLIGAVSPPGGDFSEPVTQGTLRVTKVFWALDAKLAQRRHFPSINWLKSYSLYHPTLREWFRKNVAEDWEICVSEMMSILQQEEKLLEIVQLVGSDGLPEKEQILLQVARMIREVLLQQNAFHEIDTYSKLDKTYLIMKTVLLYKEKAHAALASGKLMDDILNIKSKDNFSEVKFTEDYQGFIKKINKAIEEELK
ncbi:V-type ATP synthase subunit A [Candidatus Woesearchaeota archaeon]|nr:V-type ATP synthase subunit A [Candidatus Woesearchaeota archaeon]